VLLGHSFLDYWQRLSQEFSCLDGISFTRIKTTRGGKRNGAGRPKLPYKTKQFKITLPENLHYAFRMMGGSKWIERLLLLELHKNE